MVPYLTSPDSKDPRDVLTGTVSLAIADPKNLTACNADDVVDLTGKVALIKRGACYFSTKVMNAYKKGAIGVIVWNHENGGDTFVAMSLGGKSPIPAVFIWNSYGKILNDLLSKGENVEVKFTGDGVIVPMDTGALGTFSSWGALPSLLLKPDISAPGVNITSAVISSPDSYESWNGTSMAAPHVSGAIALFKQAYPDATPAQVKEALMNHADVMYSKANPWQLSPRKQGAGRLDIAAAIKYYGIKLTSDGFPNEAFNGKPSVSLGVIDKLPVSFKVKVTNDTSETLNAKVSLIAFSGATPGFGIFNATVTVDKNTISLEAGASEDITVTIHDVDLIGWVEGHLMLVGEDGSILGTIPFAGVVNPHGPYYYGDGWKGGAMPAVDWPWWSQNRYLDYWGTKYGLKYATYKGSTALYNRWYFTDFDLATNKVLNETVYMLPAGTDDFTGGSKYTSPCGGFTELDLVSTLDHFNIKWMGSPATVQAYKLDDKTGEQYIDDLVMNVTAMRGITGFKIEVYNASGKIVSSIDKSQEWAGTIRKGWSNNGYSDYINNSWDYITVLSSDVLNKLPEGDYTAKLYFYPRQVINPFNKQYDYKPQVIEIPFKVDRTPPESAITFDIRNNGIIKVFSGGNSDNNTGVIGYNLYIVPSQMPDDASSSYFFLYAPIASLPYTIDLNQLPYTNKDGKKVSYALNPEDIKMIIVRPEDGAHNVNQTGFMVKSALTKDFLTSGGYSLVAADGNYNINPKAYFGADEVYRIAGGVVKEIKGKIYNQFVPVLVDASKEESVIANQLYLIRRNDPGYVVTVATKNYPILNQGVKLATTNGMIAVSFSKDVKLADLKADASILKIYELYNNGSFIKSYYIEPTEDFTFLAGHDYLIVFDKDTEVSIGK